MENSINRIINQLKDELISDIIKLVQIPSVKSSGTLQEPFGKPIGVALNTALSVARKLGFETKNMDGYLGYAQQGAGEEYIGVFGHIDVVPATGNWKYPPFQGSIENNRIYGRGVLDNKGPILCALYGLYALKLCGIALEKPVRVVFGTDEESGFSDAKYYLTREKPPWMGFTPDCKFPVVYGEKGRVKIKISPDSEFNKMHFHEYFDQHFLLKITDFGLSKEDPEFGKLIIRNLKIEETEDPYLVFDISYPPIYSIEQILEQISRSAGPFLKVERMSHYPPVIVDKNSHLVRSLQRAYEICTGLPGEPVTTNGGTYAKIIPNIVPFGPSFPGQRDIAHNPDEYMDIEDLLLNAKIFAHAIYNIAK